MQNHLDDIDPKKVNYLANYNGDTCFVFFFVREEIRIMSLDLLPLEVQ